MEDLRQFTGTFRRPRRPTADWRRFSFAALSATRTSLRHENKENAMLYAILCYHDEQVVGGWSKEEDDAILAKRAIVKNKFAERGKLGPVARLMPTTAATTVRSGKEPLVIDGPFAETKEQLLGFYVLDCETLEEAIEAARGLGKDETGAFEIRPIRYIETGRIQT
jgi:hypothetical protein